MCAQNPLDLPPLDVTRFLEPYPSDTEISLIQQQIQDAEQWIEQHDKELDPVVEESIRDRLKDYRSLISVIRKLPFELWGEIFSLSLPNCCGLRITDEGITAPTLGLSHVCSLWRAVAVATPRLWSNLDINLVYVSGIDKIAALYLRRSESSLLQLKLCALDDYENGVYELTPYGWRVFEMLLEASNRWSHVTLSFDWELLEDQKVEDKLKTISWNCERLQFFDVDFVHGITDDIASPRLFQLVEKAPLLQSLSLDPFKKSFALPFSQLQKITCRAELDQALNCFTLCPNLRKLDIIIGNFSDVTVGGDSPSTGNVHHTELRSLRWHLTFSRGLDILPKLILPSLTKLELPIPDYHRLEDAARLSNGIQGFLTRSRCQLESLTLGAGLYASDKDLVQILSLTPTISHLELHSFEFRGFTSFFFKSLTRTAQGVGPVPRLTALHIRIDERFRGDEAPWTPNSEESNGLPVDILTMVESRRKSVMDSDWGQKNLEFFGLEVDLNQSRDDYLVKDWAPLFLGENVEPGFKALVMDGLELKLRISSFEVKRWRCLNRENHVMY